MRNEDDSKNSFEAPPPSLNVLFSEACVKREELYQTIQGNLPLELSSFKNLIDELTGRLGLLKYSNRMDTVVKRSVYDKQVKRLQFLHLAHDRMATSSNTLASNLPIESSSPSPPRREMRLTISSEAGDTDTHHFTPFFSTMLPYASGLGVQVTLANEQRREWRGRRSEIQDNLNLANLHKQSVHAGFSFPFKPIPKACGRLYETQ